MGLGYVQPMVNAPATPNRSITCGTTTPSSVSTRAAIAIAHGRVPATGNVSIYTKDAQDVTLYYWNKFANSPNGKWSLMGSSSAKYTLTFDAFSTDVFLAPPGTLFYLVTSLVSPTEVLVDGEAAA